VIKQLRIEQNPVMLERDDFAKESEKADHIHEYFYPLMQGMIPWPCT
jgi:tyrosyl-tRNA synthetase